MCFSHRNRKTSRPVDIENLEPRIMLSGDGFLSIASDSIQEMNSSESQLVIQYSQLEDSDFMEVNTYYDQLESEAVIERTELVLHQSSIIESGTLALNGQGLQFNLNPAAGMSQQAIDAFQEAADLLSAMFTDDIIVNIDIDFTHLESGYLGLRLWGSK